MYITQIHIEKYFDIFFELKVLKAAKATFQHLYFTFSPKQESYIIRLITVIYT